MALWYHSAKNGEPCTDHGCTGCNLIHHWAPLFIVQLTSMNMWCSVRLHLFQTLSLSRLSCEHFSFMLCSSHILQGRVWKIGKSYRILGRKSETFTASYAPKNGVAWPATAKAVSHIKDQRFLSLCGSRLLLRPIDFSPFFFGLRRFCFVLAIYYYDP